MDGTRWGSGHRCVAISRAASAWTGRPRNLGRVAARHATRHSRAPLQHQPCGAVVCACAVIAPAHSHSSCSSDACALSRPSAPREQGKRWMDSRSRTSLWLLPHPMRRRCNCGCAMRVSGSPSICRRMPIVPPSNITASISLRSRPRHSRRRSAGRNFRSSSRMRCCTPT